MSRTKNSATVIICNWKISDQSTVNIYEIETDSCALLKFALPPKTKKKPVVSLSLRYDFNILPSHSRIRIRRALTALVDFQGTFFFDELYNATNATTASMLAMQAANRLVVYVFLGRSVAYCEDKTIFSTLFSMDTIDWLNCRLPRLDERKKNRGKRKNYFRARKKCVMKTDN